MLDPNRKMTSLLRDIRLFVTKLRVNQLSSSNNLQEHGKYHMIAKQIPKDFGSISIGKLKAKLV